ncbi:MAG TPA: aldolase/citrate lyase family protein [Acidimicrobiales bacterium]|jgi:4-hydroxy-2-oxoheptanedioate aldolase
MGDDKTDRNRLRAVASTGTAFGTWCTLPCAPITEQLALTGPDYLTIDCQHGLIDYPDMVAMLQAMARTGVTALVRVPGHDVGTIGKALDAGAEGVIVPMVNDGVQAAHVASACRYAPTGVRSYGPVRADATVGSTDTSVLDAHVLCLVMIETERGVEHADEICATPGVDGVYIGPADLAISLGERPGGLIPGRHTEAVEHVLDRCRAHAIIPGIHAYDGATARRYAEMGFRMVTTGVDLRLLRATVADQLRDARATSTSP